MSNTILAKSNNEKQHIKSETLIEHTEDLVKIFENLSTNLDFKFVDDKLPKEYNVEFTKLLFSACVLHDLGKMNSKFQHKIEIANKIDKLKSKDVDDNAELDKLQKEYKNISDERHNLLTAAFLKNILDKSPTTINADVQSVLYKSIMLHHGYYEKYLEIPNSRVERAAFLDIEQGIFNSSDFNYREIQDFINNKLNINIKFDNNFLDYDFMSYLNENFKEDTNLQYLYVILKGFLNVIDHLASTQIKDFDYFMPISKEEIDNKLLKQIREKTKINDIKFRPMQEKLREYMESNVLTEAFTGSGKTAADYRWYNTRKIFLVPNKISGESFYNDAVEILKDDNVGILHGDISLYVENENSQKNSEGISITLRDKVLSRNIAKPYIIATVDQILLSMFKYPGYEKIFASVFGSHVTVDEVHLLQPKMFLILIYFMQFSHKYLNTKFHLMTATLPEAYKDKIKECNIDFKESNKDEQVEENKKIKLEIIKDDRDEIINIVDAALKNKNKVLIIRNTVDKAIETFNFIKQKPQFKNHEMNLLHSRFKFEDKMDKYKNIIKQTGDVWISTQAVEISLDLDFQVVISDNAPMESIIQRMGRNNRHDTLEYGLFYMTDYCKKDVYEEVVKKATLNLLKKVNKTVLSMKDRKQLLQQYYQLTEIKKYFDEEFKSAEESIKSIYGLKSAELNGENLIFNYEPYLNIVDNKEEASKLFRDTEINAKVLLVTDFNNLQKSGAGFKEYQLKSIQISEGYYRKLKKVNAFDIKEGYLILKDKFYTYDSKIGLQIEDDKHIKELLIEERFI